MLAGRPTHARPAMSLFVARTPIARLARLTAITFAGFFLLGYGGIFIWGGNSNSATPIWPATAFGFVMLIRLSRGRSDDIAKLAAMLAAGLASNRLGGAPAVLAVGYSVINIINVIAGLLVVRRICMPRIKTIAAAAQFTLAAGGQPVAVRRAGVGGADRLVRRRQSADHRRAMVPRQFSWRADPGAVRHGGVVAAVRQAETAAPLPGSGSLVLGCCRRGDRRLPLRRAGPVSRAGGRAGLRGLLPPMGTGAALLVIVAIGFAAMHANPASLDFYWVEMMQLYFVACSIVGVRTAMLLNERDLHAALLLRKHQSAVRGSHFKSQLLAHVSHEVRSPLSAIIGFSSMLESGSLTADRAPEFAAIIAHNGELLLRLHDDLLDLSRAKAGALDIQSERVAVGDTLKNCVSAIRLDARLRGKNVLVQTVADSLALTCDPVRHRGGAQRAGRGIGPVHRQDAGRGAGRTDRFREGPRSPDPLLDLPAAGSLTGPRPHLIALPLRLGTGA